ncbi:hypothetical protein FKM82_017849 [Ascaphus truei]
MYPLSLISGCSNIMTSAAKSRVILQHPQTIIQQHPETTKTRKTPTKMEKIFSEFRKRMLAVSVMAYLDQCAEEAQKKKT